MYFEHERIASILSCSEYIISRSAMNIFQQKFNLTWAEAVEKKILYNAVETLEILNFSEEDLLRAWIESYSRGRIAVLERHMTCALIECFPHKRQILCMNGYYPALLRQYSSSMASIFCMNVQWPDNMEMTWRTFLNNVLGSEDPTCAAENSLRKIIYTEWSDLDLSEPPNLINNSIHASNNAFEAFVERSCWFESAWLDDPIGCRLYSLGLTPDAVSRWVGNPYFKGKFLFDRFESLGASETLSTIEHIMYTTQGMYVLLLLLLLLLLSFIHPLFFN